MAKHRAAQGGKGSNQYKTRGRSQAKPKSIQAAPPVEVDPLLQRTILATARTTDERTLVELAKDTNSLVREYVAKNPQLPTEAMSWLSKDSYYPVRQALATNPKVPPEILHRMATSPRKSRWYKVDELIAANPNTGPDTLAHILKVRSTPAEAKAVAENPNTPTETLARLTRYNDQGVRLATAGHANLSVTSMVEMIADTDPDVRLQILHRRDLPDYVRVVVALGGL